MKQARQNSSPGRGMALSIPSMLKYPSVSSPRNCRISSSLWEEATSSSRVGKSMPYRLWIAALLKAARAVLELHEFRDIARSIMKSCKKLINAHLKACDHV